MSTRSQSKTPPGRQWRRHEPGSELSADRLRTEQAANSAPCQEQHHSKPAIIMCIVGNLFWPTMGELFGAGRSLPYDERVAILQSVGVALWDTLQACTRPRQFGCTDWVRSSQRLVLRAPPTSRTCFSTAASQRRHFAVRGALQLGHRCRCAVVTQQKRAIITLQPAQ
jgi:hypothetical protein